MGHRRLRDVGEPTIGNYVSEERIAMTHAKWVEERKAREEREKKIAPLRAAYWRSFPLCQSTTVQIQKRRFDPRNP